MLINSNYIENGSKCKKCNLKVNQSIYCDNGCYTIYCNHCPNKFYFYKGNYIEGHDKTCGQ